MRNKLIIPYYFKEKEYEQISEWTGLKYGNVLFDSDIDDWSEKTSIFLERILGKKRLLFMIEDNRGEKFGFYLNTKFYLFLYSKHLHFLFHQRMQ